MLPGTGRIAGLGAGMLPGSAGPRLPRAAGAEPVPVLSDAGRRTWYAAIVLSSLSRQNGRAGRWLKAERRVAERCAPVSNGGNMSVGGQDHGRASAGRAAGAGV